MTDPETDPVTLLTQDEFSRQVLLPWLEIREEIRDANKSINDLKKLSKTKEGSVFAWMNHNGANRIRTPKGTISIKDKKETTTLKKEYLIAQLQQRQQLDEGRATQLVNDIFDARPVVEKRKLDVEAPNSKKRSRGATPVNN